MAIPSSAPASRQGWARRYARRLLAALLLGVGAPVQVIAGWASRPGRLWWLIGAGLCAGVGAILSLWPERGRSPAGPANSPDGEAGVRSKTTASQGGARAAAQVIEGDVNAVGTMHQRGGRPSYQSGRDLHVYYPPAQTIAPSSEAGVGTVPTAGAGLVWNILPPVRSFVGRRKQVEELRRRLLRGRAAALVSAGGVAALHGMGGIGKTQLARAYAHRYRQHYQLGWWIPAETEVTVLTALAELAARLGLPGELPPARLVSEVHRVLAGYDGGWLLVFDNAEEPKLLERFLPAATREGHVLITARNPAWQGLADPIPVDLLPVSQAVRLLRIRTGDRDTEAATALAEELGRLPLALEQAAAYASQHAAPLARYLTLFRQRRAELLKEGRPLAYEGTVDTTFTLSIERLAQTDLGAVRLLELCALLAPDEIPARLLLSLPELLSEPLDAAAGDPVRQDQMIGALYRAGLIAADVGETVRVHRLVQAIAVAHMDDIERGERIIQATELLAALAPDLPWEPRAWPGDDLLLPHILALRAHADRERLAAASLSLLFTVAGIYVRVRGYGLWLARRLNEQALAIDQRLHEGDHPDIARSLNNLAIDLRALGEFRQARDLHEQALAMQQRLDAGDSDELALSLNNLAEDLRELGEFRRARELDEQALAMRQRLYEGEGDHLAIAQSLDNLGTDLRELGQLDQARELHEQALAMRQRLYQGDHLDVAQSLDSLAADLRALGEETAARDLHEQAASVRQRLRGTFGEAVK